MSIEKYVGRHVEVIYQDGKSKLSQRVVIILTVRNGYAKVYDDN